MKPTARPSGGAIALFELEAAARAQQIDEMARSRDSASGSANFSQPVSFPPQPRPADTERPQPPVEPIQNNPPAQIVPDNALPSASPAPRP